MPSGPIAITPGDPGGIGPEITLRALKFLAETRSSAPECILFGAQRTLSATAEAIGLEARINDCAKASRWPDVSVVSAWEPATPVALGEMTADGGRVAYAAIGAAVGQAMCGEVSAVVTGPISKEALSHAGYPYAGHTELLGKLAGGVETCMMLAHDKLRVSHISTHMPLAEASRSLTPDRLRTVVSLTSDALQRFGLEQPRMAVAALNPHAGEGGMFGRQDIEVTAPVVKELRHAGHDIVGPISGDTVFVRALAGEFDAVVAMYHDQGHIPVKLLGFNIDPHSGRWTALSGVNITLGLPFVRTSVDHGTAMDIAGRGIASEQSLVEAIEMAEKLTVPRTSSSSSRGVGT